MSIFVYVAGPYTGGDPVLNVRAAIEAGQDLLDAGYVPFVPHLYHFWHHQIPGSYEQWMHLDLEWLKKCDALVRLEGPSPGASREEDAANNLGIPVFYSVQSFIDYMVA